MADHLERWMSSDNWRRTSATPRNAHAGLSCPASWAASEVRTRIRFRRAASSARTLHLAAELDDQTVMDDAINGGRCDQWILDDLVPRREHEIGGEEDTPPFIPLGEKGEQHLGLLAGLLDITQIVQDDDWQAVQAAQPWFWLVVPSGAKQTSYELEGQCQKDTEAALCPFVAQRGGHHARP